jgi:hypothetical protein
MTEYDLTKGKTNFILVGIASLFGLIVVIIAYYIFAARFNKRSIYQDKSTVNKSANNSNNANNNSNNNQTKNVNNKNTSVNNANNTSSPGYNPNYFNNNVSTEPQVFSVSENIWTYDDAEAVCKTFNSELATYDQMVQEYKNGANWCNRGWIKSNGESLSKETAHPIQDEFYQKMQENEPERRNDCGDVGLNRSTWDNNNLMFGVNCYGVKSSPRTHEKVKHQYLSDKDRRLAEQMARIKKMKSNLSLLPFDSERWSA